MHVDKQKCLSGFMAGTIGAIFFVTVFNHCYFEISASLISVPVDVAVFFSFWLLPVIPPETPCCCVHCSHILCSNLF